MGRAISRQSFLSTCTKSDALRISHSSSDRVCMNANPLNQHLLLWPPFLIRLQLFHLSQDSHPLISYHSPKDCVLPIQMRSRCKQDEELASIRPRPLVRHADYPTGIMPQRRADLVLEVLAPDGGGDLRTLFGGRAGLDHEVRNATVERGEIVGGRGAKSHEILVIAISILGETRKRIVVSLPLSWGLIRRRPQS